MKRVAADGLWRENPALVQLLGLCPLLAVSTSVVNGIGMGVATALVLIGSNVLVSATRRLLVPELRVVAFVLIIAGLVTGVELAMHAWFNALHGALGIYVPLIAVNCTLLARAEQFASRNGVLASFVDGLSVGLGFALVIVAVGALREAAGSGTLLANADMLLAGAGARGFELGSGFHLLTLPSGAFFVFGLVLALHNLIGRRLASTTSAGDELADAARA